MRAFVIAIRDNPYSLETAARCVASARQHECNLVIARSDAVTPDDFVGHSTLYGYPVEGETMQGPYGMELTGYRCSDPKLKAACTLSHAALWKEAVRNREPVLILEHDAVFIRSFDPDGLEIRDGDIVGINDPRGATRRGREYHEKITAKPAGIRRADGVNHEGETCPDGLAGNSAYIITPEAALKALGYMETFGIWPNDAILCKQFFPGRLFTLFPYATKVVQEKSTTT